jgi:hypothetical protein
MLVRHGEDLREGFRFGQGEMPGKISLSRGTDGLITFIENNVKNRLTVFDASFLTGPHFTYIPGSPRQPRLLKISPVEHAIYGDLLKDSDTNQRMIRYYDALAKIINKSNIIITKEVKTELQRNLSADLFRLRMNTGKGCEDLIRAIGGVYTSAMRKQEFSPAYRIKKGIFIGEITEPVGRISKADLEGVAFFFEMFHGQRGAALVSSDGGQIDVLEMNAQKKGLNIESKFCWCDMRKNYVVLSVPEGRSKVL